MSAGAVLVIDDHPLFREGLKALLQQILPGAVALAVDDVMTGLETAAATPDVRLVLIDRNLPRMSGLVGIPLFLQALPGTPVVMISAAEQVADARAALGAGARGFLPKSATPPVILDALRQVLDGGMYVPPSMAVELSGVIGTSGAHASRNGATDEFGLTQRQRQVLEQICAGLSNKEVARSLDMAENTVKVHVGAIFKMLGVMSRTQAIVAARERGIV